MRRALLLVVLVLVVPPLWHGPATLPGYWTDVLMAADLPVRAAKVATVSTDLNDWPMYNRDCIGTRYNAVEKCLSRENVGQLVEKWRFPPPDSDEKIGVVHATVVVNGYVYFGTETTPTFYKLTPDGKVKWAYRPSPRPLLARLSVTAGLPTAGFMNAALVTSDTVFVGDMGGSIYALDRMTGQEHWKIDTRAAPFPGAHSSNCVFSAPILADQLVVVAGGAYEHAVGASPLSRGCTGRGFVVALEPDSGKVAWKYDVGPEPGPLDPPVTIKHSRGDKTFHFGPSTSSVWCTPSFDSQSHTVFFGTDCHNSPRQPTPDDPRLSTKHSCAVIAVDSLTGAEKWVTQITSDDVWNYALPAYDAKTGKYKDQSVGDTPKIYSINVNGKATKVVGCGTKNGGFYVLDAASGEILANTPIYTGPPSASPQGLDSRTLALPSAIGGLQTGCATDGRAVFTNGIDFPGAASSGTEKKPTGGRVVSISLDTRLEHWRHERPKVKAIGGTEEKPAFTDVGDPVASGIALANGVVYFTTTVSNKLVALDASTGAVLKEIDLGPVWCGPVVSRGRVYVGTGNLLFSPENRQEAYFPKSATGTVRSFGLPGDDEITRMKSGDE
jgi:glucose dehydrogenase